MSRNLIQEFKKQFPSMTNDVITYNTLGDWALEIYYEDGSVGMYEAALHTFRYIPNGKLCQMSEVKWRKELGHSIYRAMLERGMTMEELSASSDVSYVTLSRYINGHITPSSYMLNKIATGLGVSIGYLTSFEQFYR